MNSSTSRFLRNPILSTLLFLLIACLAAIFSILIPRCTVYIMLATLSLVAFTGSFALTEDTLSRFLFAFIIQIFLVTPLLIIYHRFSYYTGLSAAHLLIFALTSLLLILTLAFAFSSDVTSFANPAVKILQMSKGFLKVRWKTSLLLLTLMMMFAAGLTFFSFFLSGAILLFFLLIVACETAVNVMGSIYERKNEILCLVTAGLNPDHLALFVLAQFLIIGFLGGGFGYSVGMYLLVFSGLPTRISILEFSTGLMAASIIATTAITLSASALPAIKISMCVTPSIKRRWWSGEPVFIGWPPTLSFKVPVKVTDENVEKFFDAFLKHILPLKDSTDLSLEKIEDVRILTPKEGGGEGKVWLLKFNYIYNEMGSPSATLENEVKICRNSMTTEDYTVEITIRVLKHQGLGQSLYGFLERIASNYRKAAFESVTAHKPGRSVEEHVSRGIYLL
jgi:hypothetical protein